MSFGKKLYELRKQKGLSQEDLAVDLNISQSSISNYEQNFTKPDIVFLEKVSLYLNIPIEDFFTGDSITYYNYKNQTVQNGTIINQKPTKLLNK